ncbi:UDP-N-acetylglucosamine 2-epimerase (non-hydrolyzing) [Rhodopseudomonas sp. G2_2311]|uniref:non-hydrolyzing UDP-N-acetylglucosamine 2-epimerase n=1 Tax=Rhodopseudomonas sp. G2_2311 TaxID=3114287 RepID=UPI0039C70F04
MPSKLKIATVVGTRPEIIRLARIIPQFDRHFDHRLVHTGQNYDYELNEVFFTELGIRQPDVYLNAAGENAAITIGKVIIAVDKVFQEFAPDAVLILGDTNSSLAAIAAKRRKIPIFHMEAGNRCFDFRVPEEINRRIVDHLADINLTYSEIARQYLLQEGLPPDQVIKTGSPMREVIQHYRPLIEASNVLSRLGLQEWKYLLVSAHREENVDSPSRLTDLQNVLNVLAERFEEPVVVSTHPRTRARLNSMKLSGNGRIIWHKPFGFPDYVRLQLGARAVLSDSGTITEESSILNFPALNLREVHERPEGFEEASVMFVGLDINRVLQGLDILAMQPRGKQRALRLVADYTPDNVSEKVLRIILSYTEFVNQRVWRKDLQ